MIGVVGLVGLEGLPGLVEGNPRIGIYDLRLRPEVPSPRGP